MSNFCTVDIETGTKEYIGRKACYLANDIVSICFKHQVEDARVYYKESDWESIIYSELKRTKTMVAFNAKFESLYFWDKQLFQKLILDGLRIYCPQLAEYLLSGQQHTYPALRDIAVNKYGCQERTKHMEEYWDKGIDTKDIPEDLVLEDVRNDVLDTEQVMLRQVKELKKQGMYTLCMELNESLLATTEMEASGIYINQEVMRTNKDILKKELAEIYVELNNLSEKYYNV